MHEANSASMKPGHRQKCQSLQPIKSTATEHVNNGHNMTATNNGDLVGLQLSITGSQVQRGVTSRCDKCVKLTWYAMDQLCSQG